MIHVRFHVRDLLSGIIMMTGLYSVNLHIAGRANVQLFSFNTLFKNELVSALPASVQPYYLFRRKRKVFATESNFVLYRLLNNLLVGVLQYDAHFAAHFAKLFAFNFISGKILLCLFHCLVNVFIFLVIAYPLVASDYIS